MNENIKRSIFFFLIGSIGVLSLLLNPFPIESIPESYQKLILNKFSDFELRILTLINPFILLLISSFLGSFLHEKVGLRSLLFETKFSLRKVDIFYMVKYGLVGSIILILFYGLMFFFLQDDPNILLLNSKGISINIISKILYGGITEEIIVRWGWMVFIVYIISFFLKNNWTYFLGVVISALLFGISHLPFAYQILGNDINSFIVMYVILMNFVAGLVFGYLFWKYNIETSILSHIMIHVFLLLFTFM